MSTSEAKTLDLSTDLIGAQSSTPIGSEIRVVVSEVGVHSAKFTISLSGRGGRADEYVDRLFLGVTPIPSRKPSASQIVGGGDGSGSTLVWRSNGKVVNTGQESSLFLEGPSGLDAGAEYELHAFGRYRDGAETPVASVSFRTAIGPPVLVSSSPSRNWKATSLTADISLVFDQKIDIGDGQFEIVNEVNQTVVERFSGKTGSGDQGGSIKSQGNTVTLSAGRPMLPRTTYSILADAESVKGQKGGLHWGGTLSAGPISFRTAYNLPLAAVVLGDSEGLAWDMCDDSLAIRDRSDPIRDYLGRWSGKVVSKSKMQPSERGMRFRSSATASLSIDQIPFSASVGTLIVECAAEELDTNAGTSNHLNAVIGFRSDRRNEYIHVSKSDTGSRHSNLQVVIRTALTSTESLECGHGRFPVSTFGVVAVSWTEDMVTVTDGIEVAETRLKHGISRNLKELFWGPVASTLYFDIRRGLYLPVTVSAQGLVDRVNGFIGFLER